MGKPFFNIGIPLLNAENILNGRDCIFPEVGIMYPRAFVQPSDKKTSSIKAWFPFRFKDDNQICSSTSARANLIFTTTRHPMNLFEDMLQKGLGWDWKGFWCPFVL